MIKVELFKPGHTSSELNNFLATHEVLRVKTYPHARQAGIGDYVGVTYREEESNGESVNAGFISGD